MMLHSFDIMVDHAIIDAEQFQEIGQELVTPGDVARQGLARSRENEAAIFFVLEETLAVETLNHVSDTGLRDAETGRDVDDTGVALGVDQFQDAFEVILDRGRVARGNNLSRHDA